MTKLYLIITLFCLSCGTVSNINEQANGKKKKQDPVFETLIKGQVGGYERPQIRVVKENKGLKELYTQLNKNRQPGFELPQIDFTKEVIVAIFMGKKNTGGYAVSVDSVEKRKTELIVYVNEKSPKPTEMVATVVTQPFCIVKIKDVTRELVFEKK